MFTEHILCFWHMWQLVTCCTFLGFVSIVLENPKSQWLTQDRISFSFSHVEFRRCAVLGWHAVSLCILVSLVAQVVKNLPAMQETWVGSLGWEGPLEKGKATHSSILAWRIPWTIQSMELQRVGHDWATSLHEKNINNYYMPSNVCLVLSMDPLI